MDAVDEQVPDPTVPQDEAAPDGMLSPVELDEVSGGSIIPLPPLPPFPPFPG